MIPAVARFALATITVAAAAVVAVQPAAVAGTSGSLTGLSPGWDYQLADAAHGCSKKTRSNVYLTAPGRGRVFADTEYDSGWVVTMDVSTAEGDLLDTVSTTDAYTSTYDNERSLEIYLRCKAVRKLLSVGYGTGDEFHLAVTSAVFNDGEYSLDTTAATVSVTPKRVGAIEPLQAKKTQRGYRITSRARLWSALEDGYGWASPGTSLTVTGYWKDCPSTATTAANGKFTVNWKRSVLYNGRNFGYGLEETKRIGRYHAGWVIKGRRTFATTDRYYDGCGGA